MSIYQKKRIKHISSESDENINDSNSDEIYNINSVDFDTKNNSSEEEFTEGKSLDKNTSITSRNKYTLDEILVENSKYKNNKYLIHILFKNNLLQNKCYKCGRDPKWQEKELVLQLDHIDGVHNNNSIINLRMLCPNCHSQTNTYTGRNNIKKRINCLSCDTQIIGKYDTCENCYKKNGTRNIINCNKSKKCICGNQIWKKSNQCKSCKNIKSRIFNISKKELEDMLFVQNLTREEIGKKYGVSGTIVGQRCKEYKITYQKISSKQ